MKLLSVLLVACASSRSAPDDRFVEVDTLPSAVTIESDDLGVVRATILEALGRDEPARWVGRGAWRTVVLVPGARAVVDSISEGRAYVRRGGGLRLDVRLAAGDRGAFMGASVLMGAERVMVQARLDDPSTLSARFELRIHRGHHGARGEDVTPRYLRSPLPRGTYRAWIVMPARGGQVAVEVRTLRPDGEVVAVAWSSPIRVVRP